MTSLSLSVHSSWYENEEVTIQGNPETSSTILKSSLQRTFPFLPLGHFGY